MPLAEIDYVEVLTFPELTEIGGHDKLQELDGEFITALAVKFGKTRLIDNMLLQMKGVAIHA
jgi:pantoate--beta-alanine ligase